MAIVGRSQPLPAIISQGTGIRPGSFSDIEAKPPAAIYRKTYPAVIAQGTGTTFTPGVAPAPYIITPMPRPGMLAVASIAQGAAVPVVPPPTTVVSPVPGNWTRITPAIAGQGTALPVTGVPLVQALLAPKRLAPQPIITRGVPAAPSVPGVAPPPLVVAAPTKQPRVVPPTVDGRTVGITPAPPTLPDVDLCPQAPVVSWLAGEPFTAALEAGTSVTGWDLGAGFVDWDAGPTMTNWTSTTPVEDC